MNLKLNIYTYKENEDGSRERIIEKTYEANTFDLLWGPIEDILSVVDFTNIHNKDQLGQAVLMTMTQIRPILRDVFWGLTEEEVRRVASWEVTEVVFGILSQAVLGMLDNNNVKNLIGGQK